MESKKQKVFKEYPQLTEYTEHRDLYTPEIFMSINEKFNVLKKYSHVKIKGHFTKNAKYKVQEDTNTLFNNLTISIPNPNIYNINTLVKKFTITNGLYTIYELCNDIETHIDVLKHFTNASCIYNDQTKCTELSIGLIHDKILVAIYKYYDMYFNLEINTELGINPNDISFYANVYKIKEFDDTYTKYKKFIKMEILSESDLFTDRSQRLHMCHPVCVLYLTQLDPSVVKSISLTLNCQCVLNFTKEDLTNTNKYQYGIVSNQIILIFNPNILSTIDNAIYFPKIKHIYLQINTIDGQSRPYGVNSIGTNVYAINNDYSSYELYSH